MAFNISSEFVAPGICKMTLAGELDASTAPTFKAEIEKSATQQLKRLIMMMDQLEYMASAGVRVLVFAKQKMGVGVDIFVVAPQESILETLQMTGLANALEVLTEYDTAKLES
jgi:anti-anti-sigma factor